MITIVCIVFTVSDTKVSKNHLTNKSYRETEILFCQKQTSKYRYQCVTVKSVFPNFFLAPDALSNYCCWELVASLDDGITKLKEF